MLAMALRQPLIYGLLELYPFDARIYTCFNAFGKGDIKNYILIEGNNRFQFAIPIINRFGIGIPCAEIPENNRIGYVKQLICIR